MTRTRIAAGGVAALAALTLAAYGGSSASTASTPVTAEQVAQQIGATGVQPVNPPTLYAYSEAGATWPPGVITPAEHVDGEIGHLEGIIARARPPGR